MPKRNSATKQELESLQDPLVWVIQTVWNPLSNAASGMNLPVCLTPTFYINKLNAIVNHQLETSSKKELILTGIVAVLVVYILWGTIVNFFNKLRKLTLADIMSNLPILRGQL